MPESAYSLVISLFLLLILPSTAFCFQADKNVAEEMQLAVKVGNLQKVEQLLATGADVNGRDSLGSTPLLDAAWGGKSEIVQLLLQKGADVNAVHREAGSTALEYAVLTGRTKIVKLLLTAGADTAHRYRYNQTVLHIAAARGFSQILELLNTPHMDWDVLDANGNTPLDEAVLHHQKESVEFLLSHGANVNHYHSFDGRGPMHEACIKGFADLLPLLIKAGADPNRRDRSGQTPLDLALAYKNANVVNALLRLGSSISESRVAANEAMEAAVLKGQVEIAKILLESGFDINMPTASGSTYLHDAALKNQKKMAELLLGHGARLDAVNQTGGTPLHDAALGGSVDVITLFLDQGADINAVDKESGATPLMLAASLDRLLAATLLLERGANTTLKDHAGMTALDRSRKTEDPEIIRTLSNR